MRRLGWIGLGKMGVPMAQCIIGGGHDLVVYNRDSSKAHAMVECGATFALTASQAATGVDVVFSMVSDDTALRQVLLGIDGAIAAMTEGSSLVEMSTVSPDVSREIAEAANAFGVGYLRAPVSGSVEFAALAKLTFFVSGPQSAYANVLPLLELMSARQFHVGEGCEARVLKLVINMMVGITAAMTGEAMALGLKNGLKREQLLEVVGASAVASPLLIYKTATLKARDYTPAFEAKMMAKDFDLALAVAHQSQTPTPLAAQVRESWTTLIARGDGEADFFKIAELAADLAGVEGVN